jgi:hypothetical protein
VGARAGRRAGRPEPARASALCDGWADGELELSEGALWLYGEGTAELELEAPAAPMQVTAFADGRALEPASVSGRTTLTAGLPEQGWRTFVLRGAPGLRLVGQTSPSLDRRRRGSRFRRRARGLVRLTVWARLPGALHESLWADEVYSARTIVSPRRARRSTA